MIHIGALSIATRQGIRIDGFLNSIVACFVPSVRICGQLGECGGAGGGQLARSRYLQESPLCIGLRS